MQHPTPATSDTFPCLVSALETNGLQELFEKHPSTALSMLVSQLDRTHPTTLKQALERGHLPSTIHTKAKNEAWRAIRDHRTVANHLLNYFGDIPLSKISENDLWWAYIKVYEPIPVFNEYRSKVCRMTQSEYFHFQDTQKTLTTALLKQFRSMLYTLKGEANNAILPCFNWKWRSIINVELWEDVQHPLNQFLSKNIKKPKYYRFMQGLEHSSMFEPSEQQVIRTTIKTETAKRLSKSRLRTEQRDVAKGRLTKGVPSLPRNFEALKQFPCCIDATKVEGLMELMRRQPTTWIQWLSWRKSYTKLQPTCTLGDLFKLGYYHQTIPSYPVSFKTVKRQRRKAQRLYPYLNLQTRVADICEDDLWWLYIRLFVHGRGHGVLKKDVQALRMMIYTYQQRFGEPRILPTFDFGWRKKFGRTHLGFGQLDKLLYQCREQDWARVFLVGVRG